MTKFELFGNVIKHCLDCLIYFSIGTKNKDKTEKYYRKNQYKFRSDIQTLTRLRLPLFKLDTTKLNDAISIDGLQVEDVNSFTY